MSAEPAFADTLSLWPTDAFVPSLKRELERLRAGSLPLVGATVLSGHVEDAPVVASVLSAEEHSRSVQARVGVFFNEVLAGCSCGDDPIMQPAYCELRVMIDKATARVTFAPCPQDGDL